MTSAWNWPVAGQDQPLVVVVDDDQVADDAASGRRGDLELGEQAGLVALAALLVLEREVVRRRAAASSSSARLAGWPAAHESAAAA